MSFAGGNTAYGNGSAYSMPSQGYTGSQQYPPPQQHYGAPQGAYMGGQINNPTAAAAAAAAMAPQPTMQQYPPQQQPPPPPQQQPPVPSSAGSYASRSAAAYQAQGGPTAPYPHVPPPQMPPQSQVPQGAMPPTMPPTMPTQMPSTMPPQMPPTVDPSVATAIKGPNPVAEAQQNRILADCTRKVQENAYYMKQAMDRDELSTVLERASGMIGELGDSSSGLLTPKNYYELHMRALDDMPNIEEYFLAIMSGPDAKLHPEALYAYVQYCPRVLTRLYLQISTGSVYVKMQPEKTEWILKDLAESVKSVQNPVRGLFLRHFLLQATRDKLPDNEQVDLAIDFVMKNFLEMNKLWVRIQSLPGDGKSKEKRKRRERERNELRILVGTNLVRLSQLEGVTSQKYGEIILPRILEQVVECGDPLAQAYLIDCLVQVFPDEYHIETLAILLGVCPKLRDKVNVRTIIQSLMDRLSNYYADEELLDEADTNDVKKSMFNESFPLFESCVQKVYNARGPKLTSKEVIRLQTALLNFSLKFDRGDNERFTRCLQVTVDFIRQAEAGEAFASEGYMTSLANRKIMLNEAAVAELQKMLSIPLEMLGLNVLRVEAYASLLDLLPAECKHEVGLSMLRAMENSSDFPQTVQDVQVLFGIVAPVPGSSAETEYTTLLSKLVHFIGQHDDEKEAMEMLVVARQNLSYNEMPIFVPPIVSVVVSALAILSREEPEPEPEVEPTTETLEPTSAEATTENPEEPESSAKAEEKADEKAPEVSGEEARDNGGTDQEAGNEQPKPESTREKSVAESASPTEPCSTVSSVPPEESAPAPVQAPVNTKADLRLAYRFAQETVSMLESSQVELAIKLYLEICLSANGLVKTQDGDDSIVMKQVASTLIERAIALTDKETSVGVQKTRCIVAVVGTLLSLDCVAAKDYERLVTKVAQCAARLPHKRDQCSMISLCSHLFFKVGNEYQNPQRSLECLQRCLKLADAINSRDASNGDLFVNLLEDYVYFFENKNPVISKAYIEGLVTLIKEHLGGFGGGGHDNSAQFREILSYITRKLS